MTPTRTYLGVGWRLCAVAAALFMAARAPAEHRPPSIGIVVNMGRYDSAAEAAGDEANVRWGDIDATDDTICTQCFAARDLRHYLCQMTGLDEDQDANFPIVDDEELLEGDLILIGGPDGNAVTRRHAADLGLTQAGLAALGPEGFRIKTADAGGQRILVIAGGGRVGTLYGVYAFLEQLGVRWFAPGPIHEYVPRGALPRVPDMDITERPAFVTRGFWAWEDRGNDAFIDWMARNRMNLWCDAQSNHPALKKRGIQLTCGGHRHQSRFINPRDPYPYNHPRFVGDEDKPDDPYPVGDQYAGDVNEDGTLSYSEAHPEWYGLRGGKRSFNIRGGFGDNFCTSNESAVTEFMKNFVQDFIDGEWRDADSVNFWMLDGGKWCECDNCKTLGIPTDRNLLLVHRLRQEIKRARLRGRLGRDVRVIFLAYADVLAPPTRPLPPNFDYENCIATYFPIARCYVHTFADPSCTEINERYRSHHYGWAVDPNRHYRGQIFIGEYYNVSRYKCLPIVYAKVMAKDIPYYYDTGARHMHYMHVTTGNWGTKALTNYQMARMLWDPKLDIEALWEDYFSRRYGATARVMRHFYDTLEKALCNVTVLKYRLARRLEGDSAELFTDRHMKYEEYRPDTDDGPDLVEMVRYVARCRKLIDRAEGMEVPQRIKARIEEDERGFGYGESTIHLFDHVVQAVLLDRANKRDEARQAFLLARQYAQALSNDKTSTTMSSSHANASDAFVASGITNAYKRLEEKFGGQ